MRPESPSPSETETPRPPEIPVEKPAPQGPLAAALEDSRALGTATKELHGRCDGSWPSAAAVLGTLYQLCRSFNSPEPLAEEKAKTHLLSQTRQLVRYLRDLDKLLKGGGVKGEELPRPTSAGEFRAPLQKIRDQLFAFVSKHGDVSHHPVKEGDPPSDYSDELERLPRPDGRIDCVLQVLHPGYVILYEDRRETIVKPVVYVASN